MQMYSIAFALAWDSFGECVFESAWEKEVVGLPTIGMMCSLAGTRANHETSSGDSLTMYRHLTGFAA